MYMSIVAPTLRICGYKLELTSSVHLAPVSDAISTRPRSSYYCVQSMIEVTLKLSWYIIPSIAFIDVEKLVITDSPTHAHGG